MKASIFKRLLCATLVWLASATAGFASLYTADAGGGLYVQQVFGRALVHEPSGEVSELALPAGALVRRIDRLDGGWMVSGEVDTETGRELFLLRDEAGERSSFPLPANLAPQPLRINPVPLIQNEQLVGIAWIAGARVRQSAVYAALWSGSDWSPAELVSPVGPGTQIALTGAVLADGSWLLAWSAFDGNDDEIVWSRRAGKRWSAPRALHEPNGHPDVVPTLIATGRGALAAWSWSDGETYRVRLSAFEGGRWSELPLAAPAGTVRPSLTPNGVGARLLYRGVVPPRWILLDLDERGARLRRLVLDNENTFQPAVVLGATGTVGFEWPGIEIEEPLRQEVEWQSVQ